jgi:hypothetical protein
MIDNPKWDAFISHAAEDKDAFVRPLAVALQSLGARIWYDEFSLRLGDSLRSPSTKDSPRATTASSSSARHSSGRRGRTTSSAA